MTGAADLDPFALLCGLVLDDGQRWGEAATEWQRADALAVLDDAAGTDADAPRRFNLLRGRGMSKTTDVAGVALALLLTRAPARSRSYCYAVDHDQAGIFADTLAGLVSRTPGLSGAVEIGARSITVKATSATLRVESSDGASALGVRPWLTVTDELGAWPNTANHRRLWSAIISAVPKVPGSRLVVIGTAGSPTGIGASVWEAANKSSLWYTSRRPGPSPWWTEEDVEATRADLTASEYRRLILCEFAEGDDTLTSPEDVEAVVRPGAATLLPRPGAGPYVAALDVGTRRDLTALVVGHAERRDAGRVVVIDRVLTWRPETRRRTGADPSAGRVDLAEVEASTMRVCREYRVARLRFDRMQAEQLTANLARAGVPVDEYVFSSAGANRLARTLWSALRDRSIELPDDPETREEFTATRLVETGPGTVKIQNPPGAHDDIVVAAGMVLVDLLAEPDGRGSITAPTGRRPARTIHDARPKPPPRLAARMAARRGPRGVPWLLVPGSVNAPRPGEWNR